MKNIRKGFLAFSEISKILKDKDKDKGGGLFSKYKGMLLAHLTAVDKKSKIESRDFSFLVKDSFSKDDMVGKNIHASYGELESSTFIMGKKDDNKHKIFYSTNLSGFIIGDTRLSSLTLIKSNIKSLTLQNNSSIDSFVLNKSKIDSLTISKDFRKGHLAFINSEIDKMNVTFNCDVYEKMKKVSIGNLIHRDGVFYIKRKSSVKVNELELFDTVLDERTGFASAKKIVLRKVDATNMNKCIFNPRFVLNNVLVTEAQLENQYENEIAVKAGFGEYLLECLNKSEDSLPVLEGAETVMFTGKPRELIVSKKENNAFRITRYSNINYQLDRVYSFRDKEKENSYNNIVAAYRDKLFLKTGSMSIASENIYSVSKGLVKEKCLLIIEQESGKVELPNSFELKHSERVKISDNSISGFKIKHSSGNLDDYSDLIQEANAVDARVRYEVQKQEEVAASVEVVKKDAEAELANRYGLALKKEKPVSIPVVLENGYEYDNMKTQQQNSLRRKRFVAN